LSTPKSLQDTFAPRATCFGCGPANERGLRIKSFPQGDDVVADWQAEPWHEAFPGCLNGGITGALFDCHSNWCAIHHRMQTHHLKAAPAMVTAEFSVKLRRPIPTRDPVHLVARVIKTDGDKIAVEARLEAGGKVCATSSGTFVAVEPGHPAYHRWD
jgi:acyl-coenzyme A thioesterase PaaI-like protein